MKVSQIELPNKEILTYREVGEQKKENKPTILLIHGASSSSESWIDTLEALSSHHLHAIAPDLRGFGTSSYHNRCQSLGDWAKDLVEFSALKGLKQIIAVGWSFGGGISMKLAQIAPQLVTKIFLVSSIPDRGFPLKTGDANCKTYEQIEENPKFKMMQAVLNSKDYEGMLKFLQFRLFTKTQSDFPRATKEMCVRTTFQQRCYADVAFALGNCDINVHNIKAKGTVLHGRHDLVIPLQSVQQTGEYFKDFIILEDNAHMIPFEDPIKFNELLFQVIDK